MVGEKTIAMQLQKLGLKFRFIGRSEVHRLSSVLHDQEEIQHCIYGYCNDSGVLLVATDQRLILVDNRFLFVHQRTINYDEITHSSVSSGMLAVTLQLHVQSKSVNFKTYADARLKKLQEYIVEVQDAFENRNILSYAEADIQDWALPFGVPANVDPNPSL